ncbi:MAG TPA: uroporphyrinogen decarboxylase family protein [Candidatus Brocadiia bacterium]|nr:uroporphyrinogen decarboxylase family protein [Candidatus Brocadiia bacterium]
MPKEMTGPERMRATCEFRPVDHLYRREFYIWQEAIDRWRGEGMPENWAETNLFNFDTGYNVHAGCNLGWCEPPFLPAYETKVVEDQGAYEIIQDNAGRRLKVFKGRRHGFMPDYVAHPVASRRDWEEDVAPRLDPDAPGRWDGLDGNCAAARKSRDENGMLVSQGIIGGYMYLRAMVGPEDILYAFYDAPDLIRSMMERWTVLMDAALEKIQERVELDELLMAEDICYNAGMLISPRMFREFLTPCYQQVVGNARKRQKRRLRLIVDTDGRAEDSIPLYLEIGMDAMTPFEVASGCDVVALGRKYPELVMFGGIDKRVLATGKDAIDAHLEHIIPAMLERGGYVPTCDHGVPDNVSFENYLHYRRRMTELDHK